MGEGPHQSSNQLEARTAPLLFCAPCAAETTGRDEGHSADGQREPDHQREAGLLDQGGPCLEARAYVGGNISLAGGPVQHKVAKSQ